MDKNGTFISPDDLAEQVRIAEIKRLKEILRAAGLEALVTRAERQAQEAYGKAKSLGTRESKYFSDKRIV